MQDHIGGICTRYLQIEVYLISVSAGVSGIAFVGFFALWTNVSIDFAKMSGYELWTWLRNFLGLIYNLRPENVRLILFKPGKPLDQKPANLLFYIYRL